MILYYHKKCPINQVVKVMISLGNMEKGAWKILNQEGKLNN